MKPHIITVTFLVLGFCLGAKAQSNLDQVLAEISRNNKTLQANAQFWEMQKVQFRTGNTPSDPRVEYDYLSGSPSVAGNQHDFTLMQEFDFPTVYAKRSALADSQEAQSESALAEVRQDVLLEAKVVCIELVFRNKLQGHLQDLQGSTVRHLNDFEVRLEKGEGNILDVNKTKLQLIEIQKEFRENASAINELNARLSSLNGGISIVFVDTVYAEFPAIPDFAELEQAYESADPLLKNMEQQKLITQKQIELSKALWMPKIDVGYRYQGILGATFHGFHSGFSIPLWQNRNTVKLQESRLVFDDLLLQEHRNEHFHEIKQLFQRCGSLGNTLKEYESVFASLNTKALLEKSIASGQISTVEFFLEMNYYNSAYRNYLQTEMEYHQTVAMLYKYKL